MRALLMMPKTCIAVDERNTALDDRQVAIEMPTLNKKNDIEQLESLIDRIQTSNV